jgi:nucleoside-diphosphate-sugar epimerase
MSGDADRDVWFGRRESMKALVAGATGFIGAHLVRALLSRRHEVVALVRPESSGLWRLADIKGDIRIEWYSEIFYRPRRISGDGIDVCYNLASYGVDYRLSDLDALVDGNVKLALQLADLCRKARIARLIHAGSGFEYQNTGSCIHELTCVQPLSLYGAAKAAATHMVLSYSNRVGLHSTVLRPFSTFGPMEGLHRFIPQVMRAILEKKPLELTPGEQVRDYLYVEDLASAFVLAAEMNIPPGSVYNICADRGLSIKDFLQCICKVVGGTRELFSFGELPYRPDEIMYYVGNDDKFRSLTNWKPECTLESGIKLTYDWYLNNMHYLTTSK